MCRYLKLAYCHSTLLALAPESLQSLILAANPHPGSAAWSFSSRCAERAHLPARPALTSLTRLLTSTAGSATTVDFSKLCSPVLQELHIFNCPGAASELLVGNRMQCLQKLHVDDSNAVQVEDGHVCSFLLRFPHLVQMSGNSNLFSKVIAQMTAPWKEVSFSAEEDTILQNHSQSHGRRMWRRL